MHAARVCPAQQRRPGLENVQLVQPAQSAGPAQASSSLIHPIRMRPAEHPPTTNTTNSATTLVNSTGGSDGSAGRLTLTPLPWYFSNTSALRLPSSRMRRARSSQRASSCAWRESSAAAWRPSSAAAADPAAASSRRFWQALVSSRICRKCDE
jgi:hypothetical protein